MAEKKEYRSAIRSRRLIREAFLALLQEKKLEKITVTDIVKRADINRSTFYAHYPDVMGLVEELVNDIITRSMGLVRDIDIRDIFRDPMPFLTALISIGQENIELYRLLAKSEFAFHQIDKMKTILVQKAVSEVDIPEPIRQSNAYKIRVSFFIGGILNTYQQWIQGELDCSIEEIAHSIGHMLRSANQDFHTLLQAQN